MTGTLEMRESPDAQEAPNAPDAREVRESRPIEVPDVNRTVYELAKRWLSLVFRFAERLEVEGLDHVPRRGPAIIAPNHLSVHDSTVLLAVLPRLTRFIGKAEYVKDWTTRWSFLALGNIPVDRSRSESGAAALDAATAVLQAGDLFGIFPEGTRSKDGRLHRGRTGAARLALRTGAPLIPVGLIGTDEIQGPNEPITTFRLGKEVKVRFGEPINVDRYRGRDEARAPRILTDDLMYEISQLSGQEYVDQYMRRPDEVA